MAPLHQTSSWSSQVANAAKLEVLLNLSVSQRAADKSFLADALSSTLSSCDMVPPSPWQPLMGSPSILASAERVSLLGLAPAELLVGEISLGSLTCLLAVLDSPGLLPAAVVELPEALQSYSSSLKLPAVAATEVTALFRCVVEGRCALTLVTASLPWSPFCCGMAI